MSFLFGRYSPLERLTYGGRLVCAVFKICRLFVFLFRVICLFVNIMMTNSLLFLCMPQEPLAFVSILPIYGTTGTFSQMANSVVPPAGIG